ncbi:MAG TPA: glucosamine-6-phosphate deaminase [Cyclobacteriaceae bacterium]|nr:glucosamine-6-phosphate deaminase [Cyclobacteriaceae bacterium]
MKLIIKDSKEECGTEAALLGMELINRAIAKKGFANVIFATGAAQFEMLRSLVTLPIDWKSVNGFHLDEYINIPINHKASFRKFLKERLVDLAHPGNFYYINGEEDPAQECKRLGELITKHPVDVAFVGIGENSHLAFNDPPADFETDTPYIQVTLDEACRKQQMGEGWFASFDEVPKKAISMSIKQILKSENIIAVVPEQRKAKAVQLTIESEIGPTVPASAMRRHANTTLFLDRDSSSLLKQK